MIKIPPPIQTLFAAGIMYVVNATVTVELYAMSNLIILAIVMMLFVSAWFIFPSVWSFWKNKTTVNPIKPESASKLVVSGNYTISRNPMYLGMLGVLIAWSIYLANPLNILIVVLYIKVLTEIQIKPEEVALEKLFGEDYRVYCQKVRRWI